MNHSEDIKSDLERLVLRVFPHLAKSDQNFSICMDFAQSHVRRHTFLAPDAHKIRRALDGIVEKIAVHSQTNKADSLKRLVDSFPRSPLFEETPKIKSLTGGGETHFAVLSFLLELSQQPTVSYRHLRLALPFAASKKAGEEDADAFDWPAFLREGEEDFNRSDATSGFLDSSSGGSDFEEEDETTKAELTSTATTTAPTAPTAATAATTATATAATANDEPSIHEDSSSRSSVTLSQYSDRASRDRKWLERNLMPEYWRGKKASPNEIILENPKMTGCLAAHWQRKLLLDQNAGALVPSDSAPTSWLTESQALRECLWLLRGTNLRSPIFIVKHDSSSSLPLAIHPNPKFCLSSLTPAEWAKVVAEFSRYAKVRSRIDDFIQRVFRADRPLDADRPLPRTYQAFAGGLNQLTKEDLSFDVESLEKELIACKRTTAATLSSVFETLAPRLRLLDAIADVLEHSVETDDAASDNALRATRLLSVVHRVVEHLDASASGAEGPDSVLSSLIWLWAQTLQPIVEIVDDWIRTGRLDDTKGEFFIWRNPDVRLDEEGFWARGYGFAVPAAAAGVDGEVENVADEALRCHFFAPSIVKNVVMAGKSMEILRSLSKTEADDSRFQRRHFASSLYSDFVDALFHSHSPKKLRFAANLTSDGPNGAGLAESDIFSALDANVRDELRTTYPDPLLVFNFTQTFSFDLVGDIEAMNENAEGFHRSTLERKKREVRCACLKRDDLSFPSFGRLLDACLFPLVRKRSVLVCQALVDSLLKKSALLEELSALRKVYLLEAGDAMHTFCLEVFDRLNAGDESVRQEGFLNSAFDDALSRHHEAVADRVTVVVGAVAEDSAGDSSSPIHALDGLKIEMDVPWPVFPLIVTPSHLEVYDSIFVSLLQIKRAKHCLDSLKFEDLRIDPVEILNAINGGAGAALLPRDSHGDFAPVHVAVAHLRHRVILFRHRLAHFVNSLHNYVMQRILHVIRVDFQKKLEAAGEIENVDELRQMHGEFVQQVWERCPLNPSFRNFRQLILKMLNIAVVLHQRWRSSPSSGASVSPLSPTRRLPEKPLDLSPDLPIAPSVVITPKNFEDMDYQMRQLIVFIQTFLEKVVKRGSFPHLEAFAREILPR